MITATIDKYRINFNDQVIAILREFTQREKKQPEAGGIILGKFDENEIYILKLSTPTELDKANRYNFDRHRLSAQFVVNYEFFNSAGENTYLGEWHTHPEDFPSPSPTDIRMIQDQLRGNKIHTTFLLLIIKGLKGTYVGIYHKNYSASSVIKLN
jgi:integrative and conjugative element protein (TIGR02256 family)